MVTLALFVAGFLATAIPILLFLILKVLDRISDQLLQLVDIRIAAAKTDSSSALSERHLFTLLRIVHEQEMKEQAAKTPITSEEHARRNTLDEAGDYIKVKGGKVRT